MKKNKIKEKKALMFFFFLFLRKREQFNICRHVFNVLMPVIILTLNRPEHVLILYVVLVILLLFLFTFKNRGMQSFHSIHTHIYIGIN